MVEEGASYRLFDRSKTSQLEHVISMSSILLGLAVFSGFHGCFGRKKMDIFGPEGTT